MAGLAATYVDADTFTVSTDLTLTFSVGRRVKANCGVDGYKFGTIESSSFGGGVTTVNLTTASDDLTSKVGEYKEILMKVMSEGATDETDSKLDDLEDDLIENGINIEEIHTEVGYNPDEMEMVDDEDGAFQINSTPRIICLLYFK